MVVVRNRNRNRTRKTNAGLGEPVELFFPTVERAIQEAMDNEEAKRRFDCDQRRLSRKDGWF